MAANRQVSVAPAVGFRLVCYIVAVVLFVLAAFTDVWHKNDMVALGLAFFAAGHAVP
jgi:hypothetical protein